MRCPHCRESLPVFRPPPACPHCGRPLADDAGDRVRPLDLDYERILADADAGSLTWAKRGAIFAFVLAALALVLPVVGATVAYVVLVIAQFVWTGFFIARPYHRHFSPLRRLVTRWVRRLVTIFVVLPLHAAVFVPGVGLVASPAVFFGAAWLTRAYVRFHLVREKERRPVTFPEKLLVGVLAVLLVCGLCAGGVLIYLGVLTMEKLGG